MQRASALLFAACTVLVTTSTARAVGEIFPLRLRGWEHCIGEEPMRLTARTATPLWLQIVDGRRFDISASPDFPDDPDQTLSLVVDSIQPLRVNRFVFYARSFTFYDNGGISSYITISGRLRIDPRTNEISNLRGTFIEGGRFDVSCANSGRFSTSRRLN